jgi:hypothetical protein
VSHKKTLSSLWKDTVTVSEYQEIEKPNGSTGFAEVAVLENQPCKLSFSTLQTTAQNDDNASIVQTTKLFLDNAVVIKPGSKLTVEHNGRTFVFAQSGEPGVFTAHQEIVLVPFRRWA